MNIKWKRAGSIVEAPNKKLSEIQDRNTAFSQVRKSLLAEGRTNAAIDSVKLEASIGIQESFGAAFARLDRETSKRNNSTLSTGYGRQPLVEAWAGFGAMLGGFLALVLKTPAPFICGLAAGAGYGLSVQRSEMAREESNEKENRERDRQMARWRERSAGFQKLKSAFSAPVDQFHQPIPMRHLRDEMEHQLDLARINGKEQSREVAAFARSMAFLPKGDDGETLSRVLSRLGNSSLEEARRVLRALPTEIFVERPIVREQRQRFELLESSVAKLQVGSSTETSRKTALEEERSRLASSLKSAKRELEQTRHLCRVAEDLVVANDVAENVRMVLGRPANHAKQISDHLELVRSILGEHSGLEESRRLIKNAANLESELPELLDSYLAIPKEVKTPKKNPTPIRVSREQIDSLQRQLERLRRAWSNQPENQRSQFLKKHIDSLSATIEHFDGLAQLSIIKEVLS